MSALEEVTWNLDDLLGDVDGTDSEAAVSTLLDEADAASSSRPSTKARSPVSTAPG